ncbi:hypothetical protein F5884DRAFT_52681 [Xylogone sp. PMI_703]|nr:hypothetical protein F5884DRAFT_52681 [Xylogone sp. PMI_703]
MISTAKLLRKKLPWHKNSEKHAIPKLCHHRQQRLWISDPQDLPSAPDKAVQGVELAHIRPLSSNNEQHGENAEAKKPSPDTDIPTGKCPLCRADQLAARRYRIRVIFGLMFPFILQALDTTIIASALPWIASDFNRISQMNWIISAFNLTSACFIPFWGQIADIFGRHAALQVAIITMMVGSALCTGAPTRAFPVLLLGRGIQGLAAAALAVIVKVVLADKVSLKENAKNNTYFAFAGGMGYAIGPLVGGFLTNANWRWCFAINLPIGAVAIILLWVLLRKELLGPQPLSTAEEEALPTGRRATFLLRLATIDYGGQALFLFGIGLLILALTWGGASYSWHSVQVLVPLVLGAILTILFICWVYMMAPGRFLARKLPRQKPTIPWNLVSQKDIGLLFYTNIATGMAMTGVLYFVDIYFTLAKGFSPSKAGLQLLYYTPGIGAGVYIAMFSCNVWPRRTFWPLVLGSFIEALGVALLCWALHKGQEGVIYGMIGLSGVGTGIRFMPINLHAVGLFPNNIASVTSMLAFAALLGGTLSMTIMGTVFNNKSSLTISSHSSSLNSTISSIDSLPAATQAAIRKNARDGVVWSFISILPFLWICVLAALSLGNVDITAGYGENIESGFYFWRLVFGRGKKNVNHREETAGKEKGVNREEGVLSG